MKYKRILLKLSGEALAGEDRFGINPDMLKLFTREIKTLYNMGVEIAIVIGGGNIHRGMAGSKASGMDRTTSDHMGMLGTIINSLALQDSLERENIYTRVMSAIQISRIAEPYIRRRAIRHLEKRRVIIFAAGTGNPYFTTDTAAALRANEIDAEIIMKATKVDGVYDKDPMIHKDAVKYDTLSYIDVLKNKLKVMDSTAVSLCMDNDIEILVFNVFQANNMQRAVMGEKIGTLVTK
ncbi:MAG: UMP kinase [Bdellovibrionales bacterium RIFOXYA1_FULL_36_14]|nr:MAG: UMP kinase [Bdellovibrionales bacterium RIFOXYA1_FULL_36_14]